MFSGIVKGVGRVTERIDTGGDVRIAIAYDAAEIAPPTVGASIAVNGVCLTAAVCHEARFEADVSRETLAVTTFGALAAGDRVNLEPSLKLGDTLDGHWLTGHVDGTGEVLAMTPSARSVAVRIGLPEPLARYVARKGSIAVDGVSLTVNEVDGACFTVNVIPHTREVTILADYALGRRVNLEVDIVARYLERLVGGRDA